MYGIFYGGRFYGSWQFHGENGQKVVITLDYLHVNKVIPSPISAEDLLKFKECSKRFEYFPKGTLLA